jgi:hypothetical protein
LNLSSNENLQKTGVNNGKRQSVKNIFSQQPNGANAETLNASVRQDKARMKSARTGTRQPAPHEKPMRAHSLSSKATRSKKKPTPKRQTVQLTLWIDPIVKRELQRIAEQEGLTVSKTGSSLLTQALQNNVDMNYSALLTPIIETAIDKRMRARDAPLAWLLVRVAFDTGQNKSLLTNILGRQQGMTEDILKNILAMSQRTAKGNITRRTPQITELMEAVEKWLAADEEQEPSN